MAKRLLNVLPLLLFPAFCEGFDFSLTPTGPVPSGDPRGQQVCGELHCTETVPGQRNHSRKVAALTVYKRDSPAGDTAGCWEQLATVTSQWSTYNRASDAVRASGTLSDHHAELTLELVKPHDCLESQFSCVAVLVDSQGRRTVKRSLLGGKHSIDTSSAPEPGDRVLPHRLTAVPDTREGAGPDSTLVQLVSSLGLKLERIESRLDASLGALENRLEDKIGGLDRSVADRLGTSEFRMAEKMDTLENRLEDKLFQLDTRLSQTDSVADVRGNIADQLASVAGSVQAIERNLTFSDDQVHKMEVAAGQSASAVTAVVSKLASLTSSVSSLTGATDQLTTQVHTFSSSYAGGALVPVEEFFDLLHTGKKEWRLAFRGTPYIDVEVYPAYLHGTGIPVEVAEGCKQFNRSLPCANHYRNRDALHNWAGVDEVLFAIYKDDQMVKQVVFDGKGSTYTSWFQAGRVIQSSWTDLTTRTHNFFSLAGDGDRPADVRRFFINLSYEGGCDEYGGWFYAGDVVPGHCPADKTLARPMFQYATGDTLAVWASQNVDRADAIGVFLKYE